MAGRGGPKITRAAQNEHMINHYTSKDKLATEIPAQRARVYGLDLIGDFDPIPTIARTPTKADTLEDPVTIQRATVPVEFAQSLKADTDFVNLPDLSIHRFAGIGTFLVRDGNDVIVDAAPDVPATAIKLWLMGPVLAAVLYQRGLIPIHGNGIDLGDRSVIISGDSGAGKSTLTCGMLARGHRLISDDVCVVRWPGPTIAPGLAELKLWSDTLDRIEGSSTYPVPGRTGKFHVELRPELVTASPSPLSSIWILRPQKGISKLAINAIKGPALLKSLSPMTYRTGHIQGHGRFAELFSFLEQITQTVRVYSVDFPSGSYFSEEIESEIERKG